MKRVRVWVVALTLTGLAGCSGSKATPDPVPVSPPTTVLPTPAGSTAAVDATTEASAVVLPDGRSAVYLTGLSAAKNTVTFDLIEFLTGDAAKAAWKKAHPDNPDGPDNDYMIVNNNTKLRTLPVAAAAKCVVLSSLGSTDTKTIKFGGLPAYLNQQNKEVPPTPPQIAVLPFWLTVEHGSVVKFEEQFLP